MSDISERIQKLMQERNLSYGELSTLTGISKSALQRYVTGQTPKIPLDRIEQIANALNVSAAYILGWVEPEELNNKPTNESVRGMLEKLFVHYDILKEGEPLTDELLLAISPAIREIIKAMRQ